MSNSTSDLAQFIHDTNTALSRLESDLLIGTPSARRRNQIRLALHRFKRAVEAGWLLAHEPEYPHHCESVPQVDTPSQKAYQRFRHVVGIAESSDEQRQP